MSLGRRSSERQDCFWVAADKLGKGPRNAFYDRLNQLLTEIEFDQKLEKAAEPYYQTTGRKGLPPGVYFRMIFVRLLRGHLQPTRHCLAVRRQSFLGSFLGICSRQSNARSQHAFVDERAVANGSPLAGVRACFGDCQRPRTAEGKDGGRGRHGLEANASMKSIVRRDSGDDWREYLRTLYEEETGNSNPMTRSYAVSIRVARTRRSARRLGQRDRSGFSHWQDEDGLHAPEIQGGERG